MRPPARRWAVAFGQNPDEPGVREIRRRFPFYMPGWDLEIHSPGEQKCHGRTAVMAALRRVPVLYAEQYAMDNAPWFLRYNPRYWLNPFTDMREPEAWLELVRDFAPVRVDLEQARQRLDAFVRRHRLKDAGRCYVFGTGPSLARAAERDWSDGVRIVCNTIVRDKELWTHLQPHMILASDPAYHFGFTRHAHAFREDLKARLRETDTLFLYRAEFDAFVRREFAEYADRLVPIPKGSHKRVDIDLIRRFEWPNMHNILPRLAATACTVSDSVLLWGFDGRAPDDDGFWKNSNRHSYPEYMEELKQAYPAFYECLVPKQDGGKYMRMAFGNELEECLSMAERNGKRFIMLHDTYTPTLQKRMLEEKADVQHVPAGRRIGTL